MNDTERWRIKWALAPDESDECEHQDLDGPMDGRRLRSLCAARGLRVRRAGRQWGALVAWGEAANPIAEAFCMG